MKALLRMLCIIGILIIFTVYGIDVTTWQWWVVAFLLNTYTIKLGFDREKIQVETKGELK